MRIKSEQGKAAGRRGHSRPFLGCYLLKECKHQLKHKVTPVSHFRSTPKHYQEELRVVGDGAQLKEAAKLNKTLLSCQVRSRGCLASPSNTLEVKDSMDTEQWLFLHVILYSQ